MCDENISHMTMYLDVCTHIYVFLVVEVLEVSSEDPGIHNQCEFVSW